MVERPNARERRLRARAAWAYSGLEQEALATKAGIEYATLRGYLGKKGSGNPSTDQLLALADAAGIPDDFMLYGFTETEGLVARVAAIESELRALRGEAADRDLEGLEPDERNTGTDEQDDLDRDDQAEGDEG